jgi:hypothetical protein
MKLISIFGILAYYFIFIMLKVFWFKIMKNQEELSRTYIAAHGFSSSYHSGTGIVVVTLQVKDTIYVEAGSYIGISSSENTLSIIKIKTRN